MQPFFIVDGRVHKVNQGEVWQCFISPVYCNKHKNFIEFFRPAYFTGAGIRSGIVDENVTAAGVNSHNYNYKNDRRGLNGI